MNDDAALRSRVKVLLDEARRRIEAHTGLYRDEDLARDVLRICDEVAAWSEPGPRIEEVRRHVEHRCNLVAMVADRFGHRDPALIGTARAQAVAAIDVFQDAVLGQSRDAARAQPSGYRLKRRGA